MQKLFVRDLKEQYPNGLLVDNAKNYVVKSNRESGYGRYDVVLEPKDQTDVAVIIEFKE